MDEYSEKLKKNIRYLFNMVFGKPTQCLGCGKDIWFIEHPRTHTLMPFTDEALNHHADCPKAAEKPWRKP